GELVLVEVAARIDAAIDGHRQRYFLWMSLERFPLVLEDLGQVAHHEATELGRSLRGRAVPVAYSRCRVGRDLDRGGHVFRVVEGLLRDGILMIGSGKNQGRNRTDGRGRLDAGAEHPEP